jgi:hypothetical protein
MDDSAIIGLPLPMNQPACLQAVQKAGNVRIPGDHSSCNLLTGKALWIDPAENPQDVVLSGGQSYRLEGAFHTSREPIGRAQKIEQDFLFQGSERAALTNLLAKFSAHH